MIATCVPFSAAMIIVSIYQKINLCSGCFGVVGAGFCTNGPAGTLSGEASKIELEFS
jgi:hypothetical protein